MTIPRKSIHQNSVRILDDERMEYRFRDFLISCKFDTNLEFDSFLVDKYFVGDIHRLILGIMLHTSSPTKKILLIKPSLKTSFCFKLVIL